MSFQERFYTAIADFLIKKGIEVDEVTRWDEKTVNYGYCETCAWDKLEVDIYYRDKSGVSQVYRYADSLADLMRSLS